MHLRIKYAALCGGGHGPVSMDMRMISVFDAIETSMDGVPGQSPLYVKIVPVKPVLPGQPHLPNPVLPVSTALTRRFAAG